VASAQERQVGHQQRAALQHARHAAVWYAMSSTVTGSVESMALHHHAQRIADQHQVDAVGVEHVRAKPAS
jgi:hypothetical protein